MEKEKMMKRLIEEILEKTERAEIKWEKVAGNRFSVVWNVGICLFVEKNDDYYLFGANNHNDTEGVECLLEASSFFGFWKGPTEKLWQLLNRKS